MLDICPWNDREARDKMKPMRTSSVTAISEHRDRGRRIGRAVAARRRLDRSGERRRQRRSGGRVWVNGRELGGTDARYAHLMQSFD
jgi:hypothetical protein